MKSSRISWNPTNKTQLGVIEMAEFDGYSDEFLQSRLERQIIEQCELHNWATSITVANPVDILIMMEDEDEDVLEHFETESNVISIERVIS